MLGNRGQEVKWGCEVRRTFIAAADNSTILTLFFLRLGSVGLSLVGFLKGIVMGIIKNTQDI